MKRIIPALLMLICAAAHAQSEMRTYYYQWTGTDLFLRSNGVTTTLDMSGWVSPNACTGATVLRYFTPAAAFGVTTPVRVYGYTACIIDDATPTNRSFYSLQRDKDWGFLGNPVVLPHGQKMYCGTKGLPGGGYLRMEPGDSFAEENECALGVHRSLGVSIYYTVEP